MNFSMPWSNFSAPRMRTLAHDRTMHGTRTSADRFTCGPRPDRSAGLRVDRRRCAHAPGVDGSASQRTDLIPTVRYYGKPWFARTNPGHPRGRRQDGARARPQSRGAARLRRGTPRERIVFLRTTTSRTIKPGASVGLHVEWDQKSRPGCRRHKRCLRSACADSSTAVRGRRQAELPCVRPAFVGAGRGASP